MTLDVSNGRHRAPAPWVAAGRRAAAVAVPALALTAVLPAAAAIDPSAAPATGATSALVTSATMVEQAVQRAASDHASRSQRQPEAVPPRLTDVAPIAEAARATDRSALRKRWATRDLVVRDAPGSTARVELSVEKGDKVLVTGSRLGGWAQIASGDQLMWVRRDRLARAAPEDEAPKAEAVAAGAPSGGVSRASCSNGATVAGGLTASTEPVFRAVCAAFPSLTRYGGRTGSGEHGAGRALDVMVTGSLGSAVAEYVRANAGALGVQDVIWAQRIWTVQRAGEGWRPMSDRGSSTANHFDHVHITLY